MGEGVDLGDVGGRAIVYSRCEQVSFLSGGLLLVAGSGHPWQIFVLWSSEASLVSTR